jgi:hypothetical protein
MIGAGECGGMRGIRGNTQTPPLPIRRKLIDWQQFLPS